MTRRYIWDKTPKTSILVLNLHLSRFLEPAISGLNYVSIDLAAPVVYLRGRFLIHLVVALRKHNRMVAWLIALAKSSGCKVILAMDNFNVGHHNKKGTLLLDELAKSLSDVSVIVVQHGQELRRRTQDSDSSNVTMLCWGNWTAENFPKFGRSESSYKVVGPLVDGLYRAARPETVTKDIDVTLVSTVKDESWWGTDVGERRAGYENLIAYFKKFVLKHQIRYYVALTIDRDTYQGSPEPELERNWFVERLGDQVNFSDPTAFLGSKDLLSAHQPLPRYTKERYSTYYLCDRSQVTLGMSSTVLWESFGRGNKILSVNMTQNEIYDFPIVGPWSLRCPTFEEFESSLLSLLGMGEQEWLRVSTHGRQQLVHFDAKEPPHVLIQTFLKEKIQELSSW